MMSHTLLQSIRVNHSTTVLFGRTNERKYELPIEYDECDNWSDFNHFHMCITMKKSVMGRGCRRR